MAILLFFTGWRTLWRRNIAIIQHLAHLGRTFRRTNDLFVFHRIHIRLFFRFFSLSKVSSLPSEMSILLCLTFSVGRLFLHIFLPGISSRATILTPLGGFKKPFQSQLGTWSLKLGTSTIFAALLLRTWPLSSDLPV